MGEQITGEQLEASAGDNYSTTVECAECGTAIDAEQDCYGESLDREEFCCSDCLRELASISVLKTDEGKNFATARIYLQPKKNWDSESVETVHPVESVALKRVEEMAEILWDTKSYIERG